MVNGSNIWPVVEVAECFAGTRSATPEGQKGKFRSCGEASSLHKTEG